ncbi:MAG: hypothetical protein M3094_07905, partial [Actinomycetia bacterium]|nr:hypothetical protein [Actinomycetes bacterium]
MGLIVTPGDSHWTADLSGGTLQLDLINTDEVPRFIVGSANTAHVSISGFRWRVLVDSDDTTVNVETTLGLSGMGAHRGLHVHIPLADADGFVRGLIGSDSLNLRCAVELSWSSRTSFQFVAGGALCFDLPISGDFGPITLLPGRAKLGVTVDDGVRASLAFTAGFRATVGPIAVAASGIGIELIARQVSPRAAENEDQPAILLGDIGLDIGFVPPSGAGLTISGHVVSGGGHLDLDEARGRYSGILLVSVAGVQLAAIGVISTKDPQGAELPSPGYSVFVSMSAQFPAVQLGLGFTLNGIGGHVGIHRDTDYDSLRAGLTTGSLDSVMFPDKPYLPDKILRDIDGVFPVKPHRHVVGPMVMLGWGSPKLAEIEIGVLFVLGGPIRIHLLGQLLVAIPGSDTGAADSDVVQILILRLDVVGALDPSGGSLALDATLRDSSIAGFALTGDMAARLRWNDDPTFALSFGGFHPDYHPEAAFPTLRRLALTISKGSDLSLIAEAYLAVTSNTLQFGGRAELIAKKGSFSVNGWLEFHSFFILSPFSFIVRVEFDVGLRFKGRTFASIGLTFELSGPQPWRANGRLKIKIVFVTFRLSLNISWGSTAAITHPPRPVWPELEAALDDFRNWSFVLPAASSRDVVVLTPTDSDTLLLHPHGSLEIRQTVAPFGIELERFGAVAPAGDSSFSLPILEIGGSSAATDPVNVPFAPAQFLELTDDERLSRRSFEQMPAGIRVGVEELA